MKHLLLLIPLLLFPSVGMAEGDRISYLTCEDYEWIVEGLEAGDLDEKIKAEIRTELILATDPVCFE